MNDLNQRTIQLRNRTIEGRQRSHSVSNVKTIEDSKLVSDICSLDIGTDLKNKILVKNNEESSDASSQNNLLKTLIKTPVNLETNFELENKTLLPENFDNNLSIDMSFIDQALKLIPEYDGSVEELDRFLLNANVSFSKIEKEKLANEESIFVEFIKGRLKGKAFDYIKYKTMKTWKEIEDALSEQFGQRKSVEQLQLELGNCNQNYNEDVKSYANRLEQCLSKLIDGTVKREGIENATIIQNIHTKTALRVFQDGLHNKDIRVVIKACRFTKLQEAISQAIEEELNSANNSNKNNSNHFNQTRIQCQLCRKNGHNAQNCYLFNSRNQNNSFSPNFNRYNSKFQNNSNTNIRSSFNSSANANQTHNQNTSNYRNFSQGHNRSNPNLSSTTYFNRSVHSLSLICSYCRKNGHHISYCRKRLYNESKKNSEGKAVEIVDHDREPVASTSSMPQSENLRRLDSKLNTTCRVQDL